MSNSSARAFLAAFAATGAAIFAAALLLTALVDPTGLAAAAWPEKPQLCTPGLRGSSAPRAAVAAIGAPDALLVGNSRVQAGFTAADVRQLLGGRAANLGIAGASFEDIDLVVRHAVRDASPRTVWIGVDFGNFFSSQPPRADIAAAVQAIEGKGRFALFRQGVANAEVIEAALATLLRPGACARPEVDLAGFANPGAAELYGMTKDPARFAAAAGVQREVHRWLAAADRGRVEKLYARRVRMLERLLADLRARDIQVVLFKGPIHPRLEQIVAQQGLARPYARWREDMEVVAARFAVQVVELAEEQVHRSGEPAACATESRPPACPFYDLTHYRPWVGRMILERALVGAAARQR